MAMWQGPCALKVGFFILIVSGATLAEDLGPDEAVDLNSNGEIIIIWCIPYQVIANLLHLPCQSTGRLLRSGNTRTVKTERP